MAQLSNKVIIISDKKTSMRLASAEWKALDIICERENIKRNTLIEMINNKKDSKLSLTCSVRLFSTIYFYHLLTGKTHKYNAPNNTDNPIFKAINGIL